MAHGGQKKVTVEEERAKPMVVLRAPAQLACVDQEWSISPAPATGAQAETRPAVGEEAKWRLPTSSLGNAGPELALCPECNEIAGVVGRTGLAGQGTARTLEHQLQCSRYWRLQPRHNINAPFNSAG